jgi:hypothetical protein
MKNRMLQLQMATAMNKAGQGQIVPAGASLVGDDGKPIYTAPIQPNVEWKDDGKQLIPVDAHTGQPIMGLAPIPKQLTPDQQRQEHGFSPEASELLASLAAKGVSLPSGLRSREQMTSTLNGLLAKYPDKSADEIAEQVARGQVDFGAIKKETTTAAGQAGRVAIATNEIDSFAPIVLANSEKVGRGKFMPINRLLQTANTAISDPDLLQLKISINSMLNAYDQLASRGGTDVNKRAEAHSLLESAQSPEALAAAIQMFQKEAAAAGQAAAKATQYRSGEPTTGGQSQWKIEEVK